MKASEYVARLSDLIDRFKGLKKFGSGPLIDAYERDCEELTTGFNPSSRSVVAGPELTQAEIDARNRVRGYPNEGSNV